METIYLDNASTSWPKPPEVWGAMQEYMQQNGANPGRGAYGRALEAGRILLRTRENLARLFEIKQANLISFAQNTTMALNQAILGWLKPGDHAICTSVEHNSVRRPLEYLKKNREVEVTYLSGDRKGNLNWLEIKASFRPNTTLLIVNHGSNLLGTLQPLAELAELCHAYNAKFLVDAAQTAGSIPISVEKTGIDMLAFPGHKGLLGPQGTGGLYVSDTVDLDPVILGGTGTESEKAEQPAIRPERYESGTQNVVGIAGLQAGVAYILHETVETIHTIEEQLILRMMDGLQHMDEVAILGPEIGVPRANVVSFVLRNHEAARVAYRLDKEFGIAVRAGYHCTPLAHEIAGTIAEGAIRASIGPFTSPDEVDKLLEAVDWLRKHE